LSTGFFSFCNRVRARNNVCKNNGHVVWKNEIGFSTSLNFAASLNFILFEYFNQFYSVEVFARDFTAFMIARPLIFGKFISHFSCWTISNFYQTQYLLRKKYLYSVVVGTFIFIIMQSCLATSSLS